ncbi:MAG: TIM barrel protein [Anaerolineae bacterium]|nr:TIM barrel protein [Anaerolineae bacterium]
MGKLRFGTAGIPHSTPQRHSTDGIAQIRALGLDCMELPWVQKVSIGEARAAEIKAAAQKHEVVLSVHAPYYINFNSRQAKIVKASRERVLAAARKGWLAGARNIVFHAAFYHDDPPETVYERVKEHMIEIVAILREEGNEVMLRPETTGKPSQFGTVEELIALSREVPGVLPCVDFAHLHARAGGGCNSMDDFAHILRLIEKGLGHQALDDMHIHVSGIEYTDKGEREHLNLATADLRYQELVQVWRAFDLGGAVICESPNLEEDALILQALYRQAESSEAAVKQRSPR